MSDDGSWEQWLDCWIQPTAMKTEKQFEVEVKQIEVEVPRI